MSGYGYAHQEAYDMSLQRAQEEKEAAAKKAYELLSPEEKTAFDEAEATKAKEAAVKKATEVEAIRVRRLENSTRQAEANRIATLAEVNRIDKLVVDRYMSKNYEKVKDTNALKPGQVYYIIEEQGNGGFRKPVRYECPKTDPCKICQDPSNCELWKKTTWGSMTGESADKYAPYTLKQYIFYINNGLIDNDGKTVSDRIIPNPYIEIYKGRIYDHKRVGGKTKTKRKHSKSKRKQSKRKSNKKRKTRRYSKK
jgi:hypothetical protein